MSYFIGKVLGVLLGLLLHPIAAVIGLALGHLFDVGLKKNTTLTTSHPDSAFFFQATFQVLGHIASLDSDISTEEITTTETIIKRLQLSSEDRLKALELFYEGTKPDFSLQTTITTLGNFFQDRQGLLCFFIELQIELATANHQFLPTAQHTLITICQILKMNIHDFIGLTEESSPVSPPDDLKAAYQLLGCSPESSIQEVKKAFQRLIAKNHPDKLINTGLPPELLELAKQKSQQIIAAYKLIREKRE